MSSQLRWELWFGLNSPVWAVFWIGNTLTSYTEITFESGETKKTPPVLSVTLGLHCPKQNILWLIVSSVWHAAYAKGHACIVWISVSQNQTVGCNPLDFIITHSDWLIVSFAIKPGWCLRSYGCLRNQAWGAGENILFNPLLKWKPLPSDLFPNIWLDVVSPPQMLVIFSPSPFCLLPSCSVGPASHQLKHPVHHLSLWILRSPFLARNKTLIHFVSFLSFPPQLRGAEVLFHYVWCVCIN